MKIVSTFYKPSSVLCSVKCNLTSTGLEHLVVAKLDGLDVYSVQPEGLKHECRWNVWGNILSVKSVPTSDSSRSNLIVMLDHPEPELVFLTYTQSDTGGTLSTTKRLELVERNHNQRPAEFFNDVLVHPDGKLALVSCYTGKLKVVVLNNGNYKSDCDASILDLVILSLAFLPSPGEREIAILYYDHTRRVQLHARTLVKDNDSASYDISYDLSTVLHPTPISTKILPYPEEAVPKLIPVPCPLNATDSEDESETFLGGVLLVGGTRILLFELLSEHGQAKQRNKRRKLDQRKESGNKSEVEKATQKQQERDTRKRKPKAFVDWPWSEITSWCALDGEPFRYFIGDSFGRLSMLSLHDVPNNGLVLIPLGETSPPTTLTYLANQVLYVGSHAGDSQLVQISSTSLSSSDESPTLPIPPEIKTVAAARLVPPSVKGKGREELSEPLRDCVLDVKGPYIRVIDTFKNVAPILDAVLVDTDNSGHRQIVTCSGGQNTGSIHIIRKGADFQQLATIPGMAHAVSVFTLKTKSDAVFDSHILVSTLQESHVFELTSEDTLEVTESDAGFAPGRTLAARNVQRGIVHEATKRGNVIITPETTEYQDTALVVQVTPDGAFLLEYEMGLAAFTQVHHYDTTTRGDRRGLQVVAASINATQTVLALNDGALLCLEVRRNTLILKSETLRHGHEVSALSCTPLNPESNISSQFVAVAHWETNDVEILQLEQGKFNSVCQTNPLGAVVRSLLLYDFGTTTDPRPYLLAGFGDGSFVSFSWNVQERTLTEPNLTSLGDLPVHFTPCRVNGKEAVFAAGSRAMVLTWQRDSIHQSPVILKEVMAAAQINSEKFESSLLLANASALFIGKVGNVDEMHIRSVELLYPAWPGRSPANSSRAVAEGVRVACARQEPVRVGTTEPPRRSSFRLLDDTAFTHLSQYNCDPDEEITCVTTLTVKEDEESTAFFCLGTYVLKADESEPGNGRVLVFSAFQRSTESWSSNFDLSLAASADVRGCVYCITTVNGLIAVGVNSAVILFRLQMDKDTKQCRLHNVTNINLNYFVTSIVAYENRLVVGDQIASVSLLEVSENQKLRTLARDLTPLSPVCVQALNNKHIIAANDTLNLLSFTLDEENRKLDRDGFYQQSDLVTKFVPGSVSTPDAESKLEPVQLFFASSGRIGIIVDIPDRQLGLDLTSLQRNMANAFEDGLNHTTFRTPQSTARRRVIETAYGFLDGDFLERLLTAPPAQLAKIVAGTSEPERLKRPLPEFHQLLKTLQALH